MGRVIDDRVVEMRFDNSNFEKNVSQSLSTLDKLKSALHIGDSSTKDFESVMDAADDLGSSFGSLEKIATGVLYRLGSNIYDWASSTIVSLSGVKNILSGWQKYETITDAMATLHYQGFDDSEAEEQLERLNWFTDETSYNLETMLNVLSTFTASGIGLKDSADDMMGIALWAANSGANAQKASHAMVQLGQAISRSMNRQDWASLTTVGMDTAEFRQQLLDAAVACGTLEKGSNGLYRSLRAKKTEGGNWFSISELPNYLTSGDFVTPEVQKTVYKKYAAVVDDIYAYWLDHDDLEVSEVIDELRGKVDDWGLSCFEAAQEARTWTATIESVKEAMSTGWMNVFRNVFGRYGEAKEFFTTLVNELWIFTEPINSLNNVLDRWRDMGGRSAFIDGLISSIEAVFNVLRMLGEAFGDVFDEESRAKGLTRLSKAFQAFGNGIRTITEHLDGIKYTLEGIFAVFDIGWQFITGFIRAILSLFSGTSNGIGVLIDGLFSATGGLGKMLVNLDHAIKDGDLFYKFFKRLLHPIELLKTGFKDLIILIKAKLPSVLDFIQNKFESLKEIANPIGEVFSRSFEKIKEKIDAIKNTSVGSIFDGVKEKAVTAALLIARYWNIAKEKVIDFFTYVGKAFKNFFSRFDFSKVWSNIKNGLSKAISWTFNALKNFSHWTSSNLGGFWEFIKKAFVAIAEFFGRIGKGIWGVIKKDSFNIPKKVFMAFWETVKVIALGIGAVFYGLYKVVSPVLGKLKDLFLKFFEGGLTFHDLIDTLKALTGLELAKGFHWLTSALSDITGAADYWGKSKLIRSFAASLLLLAISLAIVSSIDTDKLMANGLVFATFAVLVWKAYDNLSNWDSTKMIWVGHSFKTLAKGIILLAAALWIVSKIDHKEAWNAVAILSAMLLVIALVIRIMGKYIPDVTSGIAVIKDGERKTQKMAGTILAIGIALVMISIALKIVSSIPWKKMKTGLVGLAAMIAGMFLIIKAINSGTGMKAGSGVALLLFATALTQIAFVLIILSLTFGRMKWEQLIKAFTAFAVIVGAMAIVAMILSKFPVSGMSALATLAMGGAFIAIAASLYLIAGVVAIFGNMDKSKLLQGAVAVVALLSIITMMGVMVRGSNMLVIAEGIMVIGVALLLLVSAVSILGNMDMDTLLKGGIALVALLGVLFVAGILAKFVAPGLLMLGEAIFAFGLGILAGAAGLYLLAKAINALYKVVDKIVPIINAFLDGLLVIFKRFPEMAEAFVVFVGSLIESLIRGFMQSFGLVANAIVEFLLAVFEALAYGDKLSRLVKAAVKIAINILIGLIDGLTAKIGEFTDSLFKLIVAAIDGVATAIDNNAKEFADAVWHLVFSIIRAIILVLTFGQVDLYDAANDAVTGENGLWAGFKAGVANIIKDIGGWLLKNFIIPLVKGIYICVTELYEAGKWIFEQIWDGFCWAVDDIITPIASWLSTYVFGPILKTFSDIGTAFYDAGKALITSLWDGMKWVFNKLVDWMKDVLIEVADVVDFLNPFTGLTGSASEALSKSLGAVQTTTGESVQGAVATGLGINKKIIGKSDADDLQQGHKTYKVPGTNYYADSLLEAAWRSMQNEGNQDQKYNNGVTYNQYNYSPKALNEIDIYRQTKNALSVAKGAR